MLNRINFGGGNSRQSNIEIARILSMFFILVIHANMVCLDRPTYDDLSINSTSVIVRYLLESMGIISVDVFVFISGWFMIKPRLQNVTSFIFQVVFIWSLGYLLMMLLGYSDFSIKGILCCFAFTSWDWFIKAYLMLFILAPILNTFIQNSNEKTQRYVLFFFFTFMCTYGFIGGASRFFVDGYDPLSFIGLYLLAQYVHNTSKQKETPLFLKRLFTYNKYIDLAVVIICIILNTVIGVVSLRMQLPLYGLVYSYINPLVIIGALYFLLYFSKSEIKTNKLINWIAASSFAVYLVHSQIDIREFFTRHVQTIYFSNNGIQAIILIFAYLLFVYVLSVLFDQIRIIAWNFICKICKNHGGLYENY